VTQGNEVLVTRYRQTNNSRGKSRPMLFAFYSCALEPKSAFGHFKFKAPVVTTEA